MNGTDRKAIPSEETTLCSIRPLPTILKLYAVNDVLGVDKLAAKLIESLTPCGLDLAFEWAQKEIEWTWLENYVHLKAEVPDGFSACWEENINQHTERRLKDLAAPEA